MNVGDSIILQDFSNEKFIITKIIEGGFGIVYFLKPLSTYLEKSVMKVFKASDYEVQYREALLWSKIGYHKNIAEYMCFGKYNNSFYILSRRYEKTLNEIKPEELNENEIKRILIEIINGLSFAHRKLKLIHRDIKPSNIFYNKGEIKIGDFGLSSYLRKKIILSNDFTNIKEIETMSNRVFGGTLPFMSPELFLRDNLNDFNIKTDIFAIGITRFCIATGGILPYVYFTKKINQKAWDMFNNKIKDITLKNIILKCIELDPIKRYHNYDEIFNALNMNIQDSNNENTIYDIIAYIQTLRRIGQNERAKNIINEALSEFQKHPLLLNQLAILYLFNREEKKYLDILKPLFEKKFDYNIDMYYDPLFNLADFYFYKGDLCLLKDLIGKVLLKEEKYFFETYPSYIVYIYLVGKKKEALEALEIYLKNHRAHPNLAIFYFIISFRLNCLNKAISFFKRNKSIEAESILDYYNKNTGNTLFDAINTLSNEVFKGEV